MEWFNEFWGAHGERLVYMVIALMLAGLIHYMGLVAEAKVIYIGLAMLAYNKARGGGGKGA